MHKLILPAQASGANTVHFDLFALAGTSLLIEAVIPVVINSVAVTGLVGVDLFLTRTSAVGTGGTAATYGGSSLSAATITSIDNSELLNAGIVSARLTPTGGATAGEVIAARSVSTEETNAGSYIQVADMVRYGICTFPALVVPGGQGIRVVQGSVASVGNIGYEVFFTVVKK